MKWMKAITKILTVTMSQQKIKQIKQITKNAVEKKLAWIKAQRGVILKIKKKLKKPPTIHHPRVQVELATAKAFTIA